MSAVCSIGYSSHNEHLCIFCYKSAPKNVREEEEETRDSNTYQSNNIRRFIKFLGRFVGEEVRVHGETTSGHFLENGNKGILSCCKDCDVLINSFSELYHKLRCLELELELKLNGLLNIMRAVNKVPSRILQLGRYLQQIDQNFGEDERCDDGDDKSESNKMQIKSNIFRALRKEIIKKGSKRLLKSQPRVLLKRLDDHSSGSRARSKSEKHDDDYKPLFPPRAEVESDSSVFLGWIVTLAAVISLSSIQPINLESSRMSLPLCNDDSDLANVDTKSPADDLCGLTTELFLVDRCNDSDMVSSGANEMDIPVDATGPCSGNAEISPENNLLFIGDLNEFQNALVEEKSPHTASKLCENCSRGGGSTEVKTENITITYTLHKYVCHICSKPFKYYFTLQTHIRKTHPTSISSSLSSKAKKRNFYRCSMCKMSFESLNNMRRHTNHSIRHKLQLQLLRKRQKKMKEVMKLEINIQKMNEYVIKPQDNLQSPEILLTSSHKKEPMLQIPSLSVTASNSASETSSDGDQDKIISKDLPQNKNAIINESSKSKSAPNGYNLREKRPRSYLKMNQGSDNSDLESSIDANFDEDSSLSSYSDTDDNCTVQSSSTPKLKKPRKRIRSKQVQVWCYQEPCNKLRVSVRQFERHQKLHTIGQFKCNFCEVVEENVIKLSMHEGTMHSQPEEDDHGRKYNSCPRCYFEYDILSNYQRHFAEVHIWKNKDGKKFECLDDDDDEDDYISEDENVDEGLRFKCKLCKKQFSSLVGFRNHQRIYHKKDMTTAIKSRANTFICPIVNCTNSYKTMEELNIHAKVHEEFKCNFCDVVKDYAPDLALHESEDHPHQRLDSSRDFDTKIFKCSRCPSSFNLKRLYIKHHLSIHLKLKLFSSSGKLRKCSICGVEGTGVNFLHVHMKANHRVDGSDSSKIQNCDQCPAYFKRRIQLNNHKCSVHFMNKCPVCDKPFHQSNELLFHLSLHHPLFIPFPNLSFSCDFGFCKKRFATQEELDSHKSQDLHFNQLTANKCSQCGKVFTDKYKFNAHKKYAHSAPTHVCPQCGKAFKTKAFLDAHLEYHKGPEEWKFQCPFCGKKVPDKQKLEQHQRTHTKEKPFVCQFCGKGIAHQHNWKNHLKTQHRKEYDKLEETGHFAKTKMDKGNRISRKGSKKGDCIIAGVKLN